MFPKEYRSGDLLELPLSCDPLDLGAIVTNGDYHMASVSEDDSSVFGSGDLLLLHLLLENPDLSGECSLANLDDSGSSDSDSTNDLLVSSDGDGLSLHHLSQPSSPDGVAPPGDDDLSSVSAHNPFEDCPGDLLLDQLCLHSAYDDLVALLADPRDCSSSDLEPPHNACVHSPGDLALDQSGFKRSDLSHIDSPGDDNSSSDDLHGSSESPDGDLLHLQQPSQLDDLGLEGASSDDDLSPGSPDDALVLSHRDLSHLDFPLQSFNSALEYSRCDACPYNSSSPEFANFDAERSLGVYLASELSLEFANSDGVHSSSDDYPASESAVEDAPLATSNLPFSQLGVQFG